MVSGWVMDMNLRSIKEKYNLVLLFIEFNVLFGAFWWLYTRGTVIYYWDEGFPLNPIIFLERYINLWNYPGFPGGLDFGFVGYIPISIMEIPLYLLKLPVGIIQWIIVQILSNMILTGFILLFKFFSNSDIRIYDTLPISLMSLFYLINYYTIGENWILGEIPPMLIFYFTPLLIYLFFKFLLSPTLRDSLRLLLITGLIGLTGVMFEEQTSTLYFVLMTLVFGLLMKSTYKLSFSRSILRVIIFISTIIVSGIYLFFYFFASTIGAYHTSFSYFGNAPIILDGLISTYENYNILSTLLLYFPTLLQFPKSMLFIVGVLYIFLILTPLIVLRRRVFARSIYNLLLFILMLLFALQSGIIDLIPLAQSSIVKLPYIGTLLDGITYAVQPLHIGYPIYFVSSLLLLLSYVNMRNIKLYTNKSINKAIHTLLIIFLILNFGIYANIAVSHVTTSYYNPLVNNSSEVVTNTFNCPNWFKDVTKVLSKANYNNVVLLPIQNALSWSIYYNGTRNAASNPPLTDFYLGEILSNAMTSPMVFDIANIPSNNVTNFTNYLKILGVKYVILNKAAYPGPGTIARPWTDLPGAFPWNFSAFENFLNRSYGLEYVGTYGPLVVYQVNGSVPLIYASNGIQGNWTYNEIFWKYSLGELKALNQSLINNNSAPTIDNIKGGSLKYDTINEDEVIVHVKANQSFYLVFDQGYSNLWELSINGKIDHYHYLANGYANSWLMPAGNYTAIIILKYHNLQSVLYILSLQPLIIITILSIVRRIKGFKT